VLGFGWEVEVEIEEESGLWMETWMIDTLVPLFRSFAMRRTGPEGRGLKS